MHAHISFCRNAFKSIFATVFCIIKHLMSVANTSLSIKGIQQFWNVTAKCASSPYCGQMRAWLCLAFCPSLGVHWWHSWTIHCCPRISEGLNSKLSERETNTHADTYMWPPRLPQWVFCSASLADSYTHTPNCDLGKVNRSHKLQSLITDMRIV